MSSSGAIDKIAPDYATRFMEFIKNKVIDAWPLL
jgi:hypothetical protein